MKTILHVEDDQDVQDAVAWFAEDYNISVLQAHTPEEARRLFRANPTVDAIIWDGTLGHEDTPSIIQEIRAIGYTGPMAANATIPMTLDQQMRAGCTVRAGKKMRCEEIFRALGLI